MISGKSFLWISKEENSFILMTYSVLKSQLPQVICVDYLLIIVNTGTDNFNLKHTEGDWDFL